MAAALRILHWACRITLSIVFLWSGIIKVRSPLEFAGALSGYKLFPDSFVYPLATYFPWFEIALGVLFLVGWKIRYVAIGGTALLLAFTVILTVTYFRGIDANCGCFGFGDRISPRTIARDALILLPALLLVFEARIKKLAADEPYVI